MATLITANGSIMENVPEDEAKKMVAGESPYYPGDYYYHIKTEDIPYTEIEDSHREIPHTVTDEEDSALSVGSPGDDL